MPRKAINFENVIEKLQVFLRHKKRLPSFSELGKILGYSSKGSVRFLVQRLVEKKIVERDDRGRLLPTPRILSGTKILGVITAGFPSPAEEELLDTMSLDEFLIKKPQATFLIKVSGDSMIDEGIKEGDLVLVERGRQAKSGDIVIAQVDGEWTMKFYEKENGKVILKPANKKYPVIEPKNELIIGGVVVANVRKYK